ncbi:putative membrane-spanning ATPase [Tirmania nivea]|nr:putative membrane-spanning ATPase [Tirmania nivea]
MAAAGGKRIKALTDFLLLAATGYSVYYLLTYILRRLESLDHEKPDREELARRSSAVLRRLDQNDPLNKDKEDLSPALGTTDRRTPFSFLSRSPAPAVQKGRRERMPLTQYEQKVVTEVVAPEEIHVTFSSIGGLESIIEELRESIIYPLTKPELFAGHSSLLSAPKGVLLYGPPGCGKTMLAKALAKESQACFINLHISTLTEKWYGDSNKMVNAAFSLARKLQPCIIFIDEIDAVLRSRSAQDHEASAMVKAEFMTCWDGLLTASESERESNRIMVLGATNRIADIDEAILRRLPKKFNVPLPDANQRRRILSLILKDTRLDQGFDVEELVRCTVGFSGSDLKEACRDAAMVPLRELIRKRQAKLEAGSEAQLLQEEKDAIKEEVRGVRNSDFFRQESGGKWGNMGMGEGIAAVTAAMAGLGMPKVDRGRVFEEDSGEVGIDVDGAAV